MKKVKRCTACGKYNDPRLEYCEFCELDLDDIIITVPSHLTEDEEVIEKENSGPTIPQDKVLLVKICKNCETHNDIESIICANCGSFIQNNIPQPTFPETNPQHKQTEIMLILEGSGVREVLPFSNQKQFFGRDYSSSLESYKMISRKHFAYYIEGDNFYIIDLSANGTLVNGHRLSKNIPSIVKSGDVLKIVNLEFVLKHVN